MARRAERHVTATAVAHAAAGDERPKACAVRARLAAGLARHHAGDLHGAIAEYRLLLRRQPADPDALHLMGVALAGVGRVRAGERMLREAIGRCPDRAEPWSNLGSLLLRAGRAIEAIDALQTALRLDPELADAGANLAGALAAAERFEAAVHIARAVLARHPDHPTALANLGAALLGLGRHDVAGPELARAQSLCHDSAALRINRGQVHLAAGELAEAEQAFRAALQRDPANLEAKKGLGLVLTKLRRLSEAEPLLLDYLGRRPQPSTVHFALGHLRFLAGRGADGVDLLRTGTERERAPASEASTYLFDLNYLPGLQPGEILAAHRQWDRRFAVSRRVGDPPFANLPSPDRRLRLGFVSPDLRAHSVSFFVAPLLRELDPAVVDVFVYANVARPDVVTAGLRGLVANWRDIWGLDDARARELIAADGIDVLVDLAGHTADHRLLLFAGRAAPVQVTYLGYPATTGLAEMDARIVDGWTDPAGSEAAASERLCRLGRCFLSYEPSIYPAVTLRPADPLRPVVFASFNNVAKINPQVVRTWSRVLQEVPRSRLVMKHDVTQDHGIQAHLHDAFAQCGIAGDRVQFLSRSPDLLSHLDAYAEVDIALDSFPYNGTTTTCEALWMGVPVVTLCGDRHAARVGSSILAAIGLEPCIASSEDDYVLTAVQLARTPAMRDALRQMLRGSIAASPLGDAKGLARAFEAAVRGLWCEWCAHGRIRRPDPPGRSAVAAIDFDNSCTPRGALAASLSETVS